MNNKRVAGIFFLVLSCLISLAQFSITGAVIGVSFFNYLSVLSILAFIAGALILLAAATLEQRLIRETGISLPSQVIRKINQIPHENGLSAVVDSSAIFPYTFTGVIELLEGLGQSGNAIVPDAIFEEIEHGKPNPLVKKIIEKTIAPIQGYESYRQKAKELLAQSSKAVLYEKLSPFIKAHLKGKSPPNITRREVEEIKKLLPILLSVARKDGYHIPEAYGGKSKDFYEKCSDYLDKHCKISNTDIDIVASTLAEQDETHKEIVIIGKDSDFAEAVKKSGNPHLHYVGVN